MKDTTIRLMIIKKLIDVGVDIDDPVGMCSDESLMYILTDKYSRRCFRECYIVSVDRIVRKGECIINQVGGSAYGTIAIIFEVTAIVFIKGEILTGCLIKHINEKANLITCVADIAYIMLTRKDTFESLQVGQYITVQVGVVKYSIGSDKVAVNAIPFLPSSQEVIYQIADKKDDNKLLEDVLKRIESEEAAMQTTRSTNERQWMVFSQLISTYLNPPKLHDSAVTINLLTERDKIAEYSYIVRDNRLNLTTPAAVVYKELPKDDMVYTNFKTVIVKASMREILLALLEDYCGRIRAVREMTGVYSTPELINSHKNLWNIYKMSKR